MVVYLGLGSNEGDRFFNLQKAVSELSNNSRVHITKLSSIYETEPIGFENQAYFLNAVIEINTFINPFDLLSFVKSIELQIGRKDSFNWGPRVIDIDLLFYENRIIKSDVLSIPHPEIQYRRFVLLPLNEIAPHYCHPVEKLTVQQLLQKCPDSQVDWWTSFNLNY